MTTVLAIVCARLNSSRLPGKQLLDLAGQPMVARIFQRLEQVPEFKHIVLATTADACNRPLVEWANTAGKAVFAFDGNVDDLTGRVDAVVENYRPQIMIYVCGDSPLVEPTTISRMIRGLQDHPDAEHVSLKPCAGQQGSIHEGFSPYRYSVWKRTAKESKTDKEREHVGLSKNKFINTLIKHEVKDDPVFCRMQHRISVDTPSDYQFMSEVYRRWYATNDADSIVSLPWVIEQLEEDPGLRNINAHVIQKSVTHQPFSILLVTQCGKEIGLGHLMRMRVLARTLQDSFSAGVHFLIQGESMSHPELDLFSCTFIEKHEDLRKAVKHKIIITPVDAVVFDLSPNWVPADMAKLLHEPELQDRVLIGIDGFFEYVNYLDLIHVPSFYLSSAPQNKSQSKKISYGWGNYLIPHNQEYTPWQDGNKLLVMTGGSDVQKLGETWPKKLDENLPNNTEVHWVQGPFSAAPDIPKKPRLKWVRHFSPENLKSLMANTNYALTLHGVSFFELLKLGVPVVSLSPGPSFKNEIQALSSENIAVITENPDMAVKAVSELMLDVPRARKLSGSARHKMNQSNAGTSLAKKILAFVSEKKV